MELKALTAGLWDSAYHVGVVVPNLREAMAEISAQLGITFDGPRPITVTLRRPGSEPRQSTVLVGYGREGPPYLELLEAVPDTVWSLDGQAGVHHLGLRTADLPTELARMEGLGFRVETVGAIGAKPESFAYLVNNFGMRIELTTGSPRAT